MIRPYVEVLDHIIVSGKMYDGEAVASDIVFDVLAYARERDVNVWPDESLAYLAGLHVYWPLISYWSVSAVLTRIAELAGLSWQIQWDSKTWPKGIVTFTC